MENSELAEALSKAQAVMGHSTQSAKNPHFKSDYSTLADVWDACRKALTDNGLSVVQSPEYEAGVVTVQTTLLHKSGQSISGRLSIAVDKQTAHGIGSAISYARRYSLAAFVGISPADDDGNEASKPAPKRETKADKVTKLRREVFALVTEVRNHTGALLDEVVNNAGLPRKGEKATDAQLKSAKAYLQGEMSKPPADGEGLVEELFGDDRPPI